MYDPDNANSEFVEIYNTSVDSINLTGWTIADKYSIDDIEEAGQELLFSPLSYAVIFENDYDISTGIYNSIIPSNALLLKVDDSSIGNSLSTSDSLYLINSSNITIDSVGWTNSVPDNFSIEKIRLDLSNTADNWEASKYSLGTPGAPNSFNIDGTIENIVFIPRYPKPGESIVANVTVKNIGISTFAGTINASLNDNIIGSSNTFTLLSRATTTIDIPIGTLPSGRHKIIFDLSVAGDGDDSDNTAKKTLGISYEEGAIRINEFHAEPGDNQIEFIELVSSRSIVIDGWRIADKSASNLLPITYIKEGGYVVIASDTSLKPITNPDSKYLIPYGGLPTLNNTGDTIYLVDMNHTIIDSLSYGTGWPVVADSSTEKLRPDFISNDLVNWKTSTANIGMTPGYVNSNYLIDYDGEIIADKLYHEPEFPKTNDPIVLFLPITNHGTQPISGNVTVYEIDSAIGSVNFIDIARRDTSILQISLPAMNAGIHPLQIKMGVVEDQNLENNTVADTILISYEFGSVLINEFLPRPISPQSEFVELVAFENINLTNWSIADKTNTLHRFNGGLVAAEKYIVLSEDPAFAAIIPQDAAFVEVPNFPSLNNYGDAIYLRDFTGILIDSLSYTTWWDLATGKSTEKIHPDFVSNDSTGWKVSTDSTGWTPGKSNSVVAKNIDGAIFSDIIISPEYPESSEPILFTVPVINNGLQPISGVLFIEDNNSVLASSAFNEIAMSDTTLIELEISAMSSGRHDITISIEIFNDENLDNNTVIIPILVSYNFGAVTLNEFLADPESPLSEFVEIIGSNDIDFTGWSISDNRKEPEEFHAENVEANTYVVLSEDTSLAKLLPSDAVFVYINNFPSLNNSGDGIFLYDFTGKIIDSLDYNSNWALENGKSTEKLHPNFFSNDASRWQVCTDTSNSTIGRVNSIMLQNINGAILPELTTHYPEYPNPSGSIAFNIAVQNNGINEISGNVRILQNGDELGSRSFDNLISEDTTFVSFNIEPLPSGTNLLEILLEIPSSMNNVYNSLEYSVFVSYPFGAVVLNEFLAQPDSTQAEFVEIISFSDIDLSGWSISDNTLRQYYFDGLFASANQPIVVTSDSAFTERLPQGIPTIEPAGGWPTLNNETDALFLYDMTGTIIDSLSYDSNWPLIDGRSTEKFRPTFESYSMNRWGIAVNAEAMTPGLENSLHFDELPQTGEIAFEANPFSPNGDGVDDELLIKYKLPFEQGIIKLQIFDMTGRNIATPYWNVYFPQEGLLKWDGKRDDGSDARIGIYIIKISAKDPASGKIWEKVKTVVLAKQL